MKQHTHMLGHDGYAPHSHEVRPDHEGVERLMPRCPVEREPIVRVGSLTDAYGARVTVYVQGGDVVIKVNDEDGSSVIGLPPGQLAEFRELLDRAAGPGAAGAVPVD